MASPLIELLKLDHPIIQAPMAGGATTVELVAEASKAGALGSLGAAYMTPEQIDAAAAAIRARTDRPFAINLFASVPQQPMAGNADAMLALMARYHEQLGLPAPEAPGPQTDPLAGQLEAILRIRPAVLSFTFGRLPAEAVARCRELGILTVGTATTVREAQTLEQDGVDAIVAQGAEAGGHRGTFLDAFEASLIGTMALVPQVADAVSVPVIASGGIMDGRGIAAALALGADLVQMGTAFLTTDESGISEAYKAVLPASRAEQSRVTRAFSGRPARGIANAFMRDADAIGGDILPYPLQNALTRPMRTAGGKSGNINVLSLWAGQGAPLARRESTADLIQRLARETAAARARR
ncbi:MULTISPECIES: NAD(P)H-dependent flavin oxidoreductase [Achromobacter]|uniref:Propionate 3-nitronate monooxygenase n=1 Tax=Achromobacter mucicolens TaxID=1389922 RepID=A0ABM8LHS3_9BURK|nr:MULTISPECIES: nitronate monooxygenase [Achromobacter]MCP2514540.1 nitronate monooxygenase [Achromobacter mucicolens]UDG75957.1 nitronate monooxygenase [Achromobacter sp. 77]CAB3894116.1 Nitronate monooxygenase [Achromobacter mucicolens]